MFFGRSADLRIGVLELTLQHAPGQAKDLTPTRVAPNRSSALQLHPNIIRHTMTDAMMPTASAINPAGTAWRVRRTFTAPK